MKTKSLFILFCKRNFILSLIIISTHNAFCASGGIDIQKVLDAGGEVIIRSANGDAQSASVSKKSTKSSKDDPFKVYYNDAPTDSGNADEEEDKTGTDSDNKLTPKQAEFQKECEEIEEMTGTFDAKYNECHGTIPDGTLSMNKVKEIIDKTHSMLSEDPDTTCNQAIYIPKKSWSILCTDSDAFSGAFVIHYTNTEITCYDGFEFNDDNGTCVKKEKESSIAENTAESIVASNDDLFELDDSDSQTVSVSDFETKALDSDFEAITLIEKSKYGNDIDSCNDVNANSDLPYIKCDIKNSTKKYKFYFKSIGGAAKEPELTNLSDTKSQKEQQLRQDAQSILTAFNEQKEKLKNK